MDGCKDTILKYYEREDTIATTSCGNQSVFLIDVINSLDIKIKMVFVNTGFLFKETIDYFHDLRDAYPKLDWIEVKPNHKIDAYKGMHEIDPDKCCMFNKIIPLREYIEKNHINTWISGIRSSQTQNRKTKNIIEQENSVKKVYPFLHISDEYVSEYVERNGLLKHPLHKNYSSIGCECCTQKGNDRQSCRWTDKGKTECGLFK